MAVNTAVNFLTFVIEEVGIFAVGATVVGWVAKDLISQHFDKELSRHQAELEKDKLRFSELHTQRAEITAELYERFVEFEEDMWSLTDPLVHTDESALDEEQLKSAQQSGDQFVNFYKRNRIYFPSHICETIDEIHREMDGALINVKIHHDYSDQSTETSNSKLVKESWEKVTQNEVPELKSDLEHHFRELLGVKVERDNDTLRKVETEQEVETDTTKQ
jgi:hypothetical protein